MCHFVTLKADAAATFNSWAAHFNKAYAAAESEEKKGVWLRNVDYILAAHINSSVAGSTVALNGLADLDDEEFRARYLGYHRSIQLG